jgi:Cu-Zn family superoxide dismutase
MGLAAAAVNPDLELAMGLKSALTICLVAAGPFALAAEKPNSATIFSLTDQGVGDPIGRITFRNSKGGLVLSTDLRGLTPGEHGIHIHALPDCRAVTKDGQSVAGLAAGGHLDPEKTGKHLGPKGGGHLGDLPILKVAANGAAKEKLLAPHLKLADVTGHAIVIHQGGDNYSDEPKPLGGGGPRIACGVIE